MLMSLFNLLLETIQYKIVKCIIMALDKNKSKLTLKTHEMNITAKQNGLEYKCELSEGFNLEMTSCIKVLP